MAEFTGVSIRTLHYYDEIDLLRPSYVTKKGYRQYSNADVLRLQKIMLLKEVGLSLKDIKKIISSDDLDFQKYILQKQIDILLLKKKRMEELIDLIELTLQGETIMTFKKFSTIEIEESFDAMLEKLGDSEGKEYARKNGGTEEEAKKKYVHSFKNYDGDLKYYMGNKKLGDVIKDAPSVEVIEEKRVVLSELYRKLGRMVSRPIDDNVKGLIYEIYRETISMFPIEKSTELFIEMAELYAQNPDAAAQFDLLYGKGTALYYLKCVRTIFNNQK